jgi:hypothetical protein
MVMRETIKRAAIVSLTVLMAALSVTPMRVNAEERPKFIAIMPGRSVTVTTPNPDSIITEVPLFNQGDYPNDPYGAYGSVASHGCGITCVAMAATYLKNEFHSPAALARQFGIYNTEHGSYWSLFKDSAEKLDLPFQEQTTSWSAVTSALQNGQLVVSIQTSGLFTTGGHFILLTGITEDGRILVNDPNGFNWDKDETMIEGFTNGFLPEQITQNGCTYWIYGPKETTRAENSVRIRKGYAR